jgi:hypothetical protein
MVLDKTNKLFAVQIDEVMDHVKDAQWLIYKRDVDEGKIKEVLLLCK